MKNDAPLGEFLEEHRVLRRHTALDRATQKALHDSVAQPATLASSAIDLAFFEGTQWL